MKIYIGHREYVVKVTDGNVRLAGIYDENDRDFDLFEVDGETAILLGVALISAGQEAMS